MASKNILINGVVTDLRVEFVGDKILWLRDAPGYLHILPKDFWEGKAPATEFSCDGNRYELCKSPHQELIQRIEYVLHSGYDATDRELLREALAALKERA